jgi:FkbM family methyltransferase
VHSFEPDPDNFTRLYAALCNVPNVRLNQLAVSDKTEESRLYISKELNVDHRAYPTEGETRKAISIQSTTLDNYFPPGEHVDLIKMDIQGFELQALRGAERVLADNPEIKLLLECWPYGLRAAGDSAQALFSFFRQHGRAVRCGVQSGRERGSADRGLGRVGALQRAVDSLGAQAGEIWEPSGRHVLLDEAGVGAVEPQYHDAFVRRGHHCGRRDGERERATQQRGGGPHPAPPLILQIADASKFNEDHAGRKYKRAETRRQHH